MLQESLVRGGALRNTYEVFAKLKFEMFVFICHVNAVVRFFSGSSRCVGSILFRKAVESIKFEKILPKHYGSKCSCDL